MLYTNIDLYTRLTYYGFMPCDSREFLSKLIFFNAEFYIDLSKLYSWQYYIKI